MPSFFDYCTYIHQSALEHAGFLTLNNCITIRFRLSLLLILTSKPNLGSLFYSQLSGTVFKLLDLLSSIQYHFNRLTYGNRNKRAGTNKTTTRRRFCEQLARPRLFCAPPCALHVPSPCPYGSCTSRPSLYVLLSVPLQEKRILRTKKLSDWKVGRHNYLTYQD